MTITRPSVKRFVESNKSSRILEPGKQASKRRGLSYRHKMTVPGRQEDWMPSLDVMSEESFTSAMDTSECDTPISVLTPFTACQPTDDGPSPSELPPDAYDLTDNVADTGVVVGIFL